MSKARQASYGKAIDDLLALPPDEFTRKLAGYTWRTTPPELRNGVSLEDFTERLQADPLRGIKYYQGQTRDNPKRPGVRIREDGNEGIGYAGLDRSQAGK